jgi:hypothetical protein
MVESAQPHGVLGKRFIPSTLVLEDPFPSDELDLFTFNRGPKDKEGRETSFGFEFGKRLTPDLAISIVAIAAMLRPWREIPLSFIVNSFL